VSSPEKSDCNLGEEGAQQTDNYNDCDDAHPESESLHVVSPSSRSGESMGRQEEQNKEEENMRSSSWSLRS